MIELLIQLYTFSFDSINPLLDYKINLKYLQDSL